jgi:uncharacterized protein (DUF1015 family)
MSLDVRPIAGLRFNPARFTDLSALTAPPYDVIAPDLRARLAAEPNNIVHVDLPVRGNETGDYADAEEGPYRRAAEWLAARQADGVLVRDSAPAFYVYTQEFRSGGRAHTRTGLIGRVRLAEFDEGLVLPHEQTFSGPKRDRLLLMRHTAVQLSPIFGLFADPGNRVLGPLAGSAKWEQTATDVFGVVHRVAGIRDPEEIARLGAALADKQVYIADGHHRYETALNYRRELRESGRIAAADPEHPANFCLFVLVSMDDPGLIIQPTHRVLRWPTEPGPDTFEELLRSCGNVQQTRVNGDTLDRLEDVLNRPGMAGHVGVYHAGADIAWDWRPDTDDPLAKTSPARAAAWRRLDVAVLHELLLNQVLSALSPAPARVEIRYVHQAREAAELCRTDGFHAAFILRPTPLAALREVTAARELMPQKSTYFYPKLLTGLVLNPLG